MAYRLLFVQGKTHWLYSKFILHRLEQFGNYTLGFIPNLRVLIYIYRERQINYLNNIFGKVWLIKFVANDLLVIVI